MGRELIIAEKPSVATTIANFLKLKRYDGYFEGDKYIVTFAIGHLVSLLDMEDYDDKYKGEWKLENYPFIPDTYRFKIDSDKKKQFKIIKSLIERNDVVQIINGCDSDREGENICSLICLACKNKKPVKRIWVNEWTPEDIRYGLANLKDNSEMIPLQDAGYARIICDFSIGINLTGSCTVKYGNKCKTLNLGRVILPTVKMIYDRDMTIKNFKPEDYYELYATFSSLNGTYKGKYIRDKDTKFKNIKEIENIPNQIHGKNGDIINKTVKTSKNYAPKLFSLTELQGYITEKYNGWSPDKVLKTCQNLYEGKGNGGFITYPRTDSSYLEETLISKTEKTLNVLKKGLSYEDKIKFHKDKRVFDSSKVDSHSAIIPTHIIPSNLTNDEQIVYEAIKKRFLANFMPPAEYENTEITTVVASHTFKTKGKILTFKGYLEIFGKLEQEDLENQNDDEKQLLPNVNKGDVVKVDKAELLEKQTIPPKSYTSKSLLTAMKNCGKNVPEDDESLVLLGYSIGTSSTRAEVIKKILKVGYVKEKGKSLVITELGIRLIENLPVKELMDVDYTGKLEKSLKDIEKGKLSKDNLLAHIKDFVINSINNIKNTDCVIVDKSILKQEYEDKVLGKCPLCGSDVVENNKNFGCVSYNETGCPFAIWKNDSFLANFKKKPTKTMVKSILKNGKCKVKNMVSKEKGKFDCELEYKLKENGYWGWEFVKRSNVIGKCFNCGKDVKENKNSYNCSNCDFSLWKDNNYLKNLNIILTKKVAKEFVTKGKAYFEGLHSVKKSKNYNATLVLSKKGKYWGFDMKFGE